jgi:hypothetical protein
MTASDAIVLVWMAAGLTALFYSVRRLRNALFDERARIAEAINGHVLVVTRSRIRTARQSIAMASCIFGAAALAAADRVIGGPPIFGIAVLLLLTAVPLVFVWKLRDDDRSYERLLVMLMRSPSVRERSGDQ